MNSWTKQKGYPVVSVKVKDRKLVFEQVLVSGLFHSFFPEITYLNPDAYRVVSFCNESRLIIV